MYLHRKWDDTEVSKYLDMTKKNNIGITNPCKFEYIVYKENLSYGQRKALDTAESALRLNRRTY